MSTSLLEDSTRFRRLLVGIGVKCGVTGSHMGRIGVSPPQYWRHHSTGATLSSPWLLVVASIALVSVKSDQKFHSSLSDLRQSMLPLLLLLCGCRLLPTVAAGCSGHGDICTAMLNLHCS
jgi:hypothetical protein